MRRLIQCLALLATTQLAHANSLDNGDLAGAIASNIRTGLDDTLILSEGIKELQEPVESFHLKILMDGEYDRAIRLREHFLALHRRLEGKEDPHMLGALSHLYSKAGQHDKAVSLAEQALKLRRVLHGEKNFGVRTAVNSLANIYREAGQFEKALVLQDEAVRFNRDKFGETNVATFISELHLIDTYTALGQYDLARALQERLVELWTRERGSKSDFSIIPMRGLANSYRALGQPAQALPLLERFVEFWRNERQKEFNVAFDILLATISLARTYHDLGRMDKARDLIPDIIKETEKLRAARPRAAEDRQRAFAMFSDVYQQMAGWSAKAGQYEEAFNIGDLSKARTLAEGIRMQVALRSLPPKEQQALQDMGSRSQELRDRLNAALGKAAQDANEFATIQKELENIRDRFDKFVAQLPTVAELPEINAPTARRAGELLGKDTVFISFLVSTEGVRPHLPVKAGTHERVDEALKGKAQAFVIDSAGKIQWIDLGRLPNHASTVAAYRELMTAVRPDDLRGQLVALKEGGYQWVGVGQRPPEGSRPEAVPAGSTPAAHALRVLQRYWHDALIKPLLPLAGAYPRWIVSPDKDLALLPFDTLPETFTAKGEPEKLLAEQHNITLVQSFSVYVLLKKREADYAKLPRPKALLAMGNAVYEQTGWAQNRGMRRGSGQRSFAANSAGTSPAPESVSMVENAEQRAMAGLKWENLPGTAEEIRRITSLFSKADGGADGLTGAYASEAKLRELNKSGKLQDYRYLLFSAHGYLAQNPTLSSLVLSQHGNPAGLDGYVTAGEWPLYDVKSDLTVLSACDTGVGKVQAGESVVGLPYALFVAGNRNTLLSLWPVADEATAEFMARFFGKLKQGKSQPAALSETKLEFMRHPTWSRPVFWAAFVLYGV